ncbi:MAG: hypothetical protein ABIS47_06770 [Acidimicrobiales bacterium]
MPHLDDSAAYAANWKTVLAADAAAGVVIALVGLAILATVHVVVGAMLASGGAVYLIPVARRARHWAALRRDAGL